MTALLDPEFVTALRYIYAVLAILAGTGFVATLMVRWDNLHLGEQILRIGLIAEHVTITYAAYVAIELSNPPTAVAVFLTASLVVICCGFAVWAADIALNGDPGPVRLTDQR